MTHQLWAVPGGGTEGGTTRYSVPQVARLLGISERAVRKRITAGTLSAERTRTGWWVDMEAVPTEPSAVPAEPSPEPAAALGGTAVPGGGTSTALTEAQRAEALGEYAAAILAPAFATIERLEAVNRAQAETIGRLQAELATLQERVTVHSDQVAEVTASPRPWWRWWRR
jgi:hypothetical protein